MGKPGDTLGRLKDAKARTAGADWRHAPPRRESTLPPPPVVPPPPGMPPPPPVPPPSTVGRPPRQDRAPTATQAPKGHHWRYLHPADLKRLRNMEFVARRIVEGYFAGKHRSPFRDLSQEFADYRAYVPGDDLRTLDWKAFARSDRYYIKRYRKDTGMPCHLLLDKSRSMAYRGQGDGQLSKLEYACFLVAALGFLITKQGDQAGLCVFDDQLRDYRPPASAMSHLFGILNVLEGLKPSGLTRTAGALRTAFQIIRRRSLLIVVSDFLDDPGEVFSALSMFAHKQFEIILFHVLHDDELNLPSLENARFIDLETHHSLVAEPGVIRETYQDEFGKYLAAMRSHARARRIDYNLVATSTPYNKAIEKYLAIRQRVTGWGG